MKADMSLPAFVLWKFLKCLLRSLGLFAPALMASSAQNGHTQKSLATETGSEEEFGLPFRRL